MMRKTLTLTHSLRHWRVALPAAVAMLVASGASVAMAQRAAPAAPKPATTQTTTAPQPAPAAAGAAASPNDYVIGPEDVLSILYWREKDLSGDVKVRPDGKISLPLLNDVVAAGLTPAQLRDRLTEASRKYVEDPNVTVVVKEMNSRKVFITGEVARPGAYPLISTLTVMQLIAVAGGLNEFAEAKSISIMRVEAGKTRTFPFDYRNVASGKKPEQNIVLKPGDTVVVPER